MRILLSALSRFTQPTGICRHSANLARCLAESSAVEGVTLALGSWQIEYFDRCFQNLRSPKIQIVPVDIPNTRLRRNFWFARGLPRLAAVLEPDVVHLSFPVPVFRSAFRVPVFVSVHDAYAYEFPETFGCGVALLKRAITSLCLRQSAAVCCVSETTRRSVQRQFPKLAEHKPVRTVFNCADHLSGLPGKPIAHIDASVRFFLSVGQHQKNKRIDLQLQAFAKLRSAGAIAPDVRLVAVGSPASQTERLEALSRELGLQSSVLWLPPISDSELVWLYNHIARPFL